MSDYARMQRLLDELRKDILNYTQSNFETQDLMDQFFKVKQNDEATYELFVLLYNEFQMTHKFHKKQFMEMMDKSLTIKSATISQMKHEREKFLPFGTRVMNAMTYTNAKRTIIAWMIIMVFLVGLYTANPSAFESISGTVVDVVDEYNEKDD